MHKVLSKGAWNMTVYGYARVSTDGQSLTSQDAELHAAGCAKVYAEKISGARSDRAELAKVLKRLDTGDVLIVTRLDRLARSTRDLLVGWSMRAAMTAQLVTDALVMAIWRRGQPDALLHHSDRGSQYTSEQFQKLMADHGVVCSMSRSGNVWDNAAMESFFSSLKTERT